MKEGEVYTAKDGTTILILERNEGGKAKFTFPCRTDGVLISSSENVFVGEGPDENLEELIHGYGMEKETRKEVLENAKILFDEHKPDEA
jgi:hypothetical protein